MFDELKKNYNFNDSKLSDITSSESTNNSSQYVINDVDVDESFSPDLKYYIETPKRINVFENVNNKIYQISNNIIHNKVILFTKCFMDVLRKFENTLNIFPLFTMNEDEDSVFLEWVFKDFRIGFTFCENDEESMWFMVTNRNLEELTVSGDLKEKDYNSIISKVIAFVLENS